MFWTESVLSFIMTRWCLRSLTQLIHMKLLYWLMFWWGLLFV